MIRLCLNSSLRSCSLVGAFLILFGLIAGWSASAAEPAKAKAPGLAPAGAPDLEEVRPSGATARDGKSLLVLHYHRPDGIYEGWGVWGWADNQEGFATSFAKEDAFGKVAFVELDAGTAHANFIVRRGDWEQKDVGHDRSIRLGADRVAEVWLISGDPNVYTDPSQLDFSIKVRAAFLDRADRIRVSLNQAIDAEGLDPRLIGLTVGGVATRVSRVSPVGQGGVSKVFDLKLQRPLRPEQLREPIQLTLPGLGQQRVYARNVLAAQPMTALDAELGAFHQSDSTTFRAWSPVASRVDLLLYSSVEASEPTRVIAMSPGKRGLWEARVAGDLHGLYYQYRFTSYGEERTVADIHCFAASPDSQRSMVVDLSRTDPEGFREHKPPRLKRATDEIIYEIHVRDYSVADPNVPAQHRGKYLGMTHISPGGEGKASTSLTHLKELGVTAVHLLPIQDFGNERHSYNWGYWTSLFNVPESDYSTSPGDPAQTIYELKQTIQTLHENGIRVILDVVYNHTSITGQPSPYEEAVPWYYFRTLDDGSLRNDAGTGNSIADERPMVRKYIVDSLKHWATEYKIDGFRFDLVGTHQPETVRAIVKELRAVRPDITLYGEPWTGGGPTYFGKGAQRGTGFAVFNDHFRNAIRGDLDGAGKGYATGGRHQVTEVRNGIAGAIDDFAEHPSESVNYVSAHDNRTFWDKLEHTLPDATDDQKRSMQKLAHGMVLTSQGLAFIHGGADFARTKGGNHNSYNAGDEVNLFDWERKTQYIEVHQFVSEMIRLRREHPAFRLHTREQVRSGVRFFDDLPDGVVGYALNGKKVKDPWSMILVYYNPGPGAAVVSLPKGRWKTAIDSSSDRRGEVISGPLKMQGVSMWIGYQE